MDTLLQSLPEDLTYDCWPLALWDDCGALIVTILSNGDETSGVCNDNIVREDVCYTLFDSYGYEPFKSCRAYRGEWLEKHGSGWEIGCEQSQ